MGCRNSRERRVSDEEKRFLLIINKLEQQTLKEKISDFEERKEILSNCQKYNFLRDKLIKQVVESEKVNRILAYTSSESAVYVFSISTNLHDSHHWTSEGPYQHLREMFGRLRREFPPGN
jgi:hypothetical protein